MIPGLITSEVEFFAVSETEVRCFHQGQNLGFDEFPEWVIAKIESEMGGNTHSEEEIKGFIYSNFGGIDGEPDISINGELSISEYVDGVTKKLLLSNGHYLTPRQVEILKHINLSNQEIADKLFISTESVKTHIQNIMKETGLSGRVELAIFATKKGII